METDGEHEARLSKGLIGVVALALVGGGGGTLAYSLFGASDAPESESENSITIAEEASGDVPDFQPPTKETVDGPIRMPAETDTVSDDPPAPGPLPARPRAPIATPDIKAAFVVRFQRGGKVDECLSLYRKDKDASRDAFADWASQHPELDGMRLQRVNYSGEAILAYDSSEDAKPLANAKQLQARIQSLESVRYADPDYTAFPGKGE